MRERNSLPATVELNNVQHFSYGQFDSGEFAFWAAGESGWFEIRPARQYRAIYRDMVEAIGILYFVADIYRDVKGVKKRKQITVDFVLSQVRQSNSMETASVTHSSAVRQRCRVQLPRRGACAHNILEASASLVRTHASRQGGHPMEEYSIVPLPSDRSLSMYPTDPLSFRT